MSNPRKKSVEKYNKATILKAEQILEASGHLGVLRMGSLKQNDRQIIFKLVQAVVILCIISTVSIAGNVLQYNNKPEPVHFGITPDRRVVKLTPLNENFFNNADVRNWLIDTVVRSTSLSFTRWKQELADVKPHFFSDAYEEWIGALEDSGTLPVVRGDGGYPEANTITNATGPARIIKEVVINGRKTWRVEFPLVITFEFRSGQSRPQNRLAIAIVQRVPVTEHPKGVKIKQLNLKRP